MSHGVKKAAPSGPRVSISTGVKKMIENIKEITGQNHSEEEIYATLKECAMDPNEALTKLLLLDTFHEVKSKRDRKKEGPSKDATESKGKPGAQPRVNRAGRGNHSSRYSSQDAGGGRNSSAFKENATAPSERSTGKAHLATGQEMKKNTNSLVVPVSNGPSGTASRSSNIMYDKHNSAAGVVNHQKATGDASMTKGLLPLPSVGSISNSNFLRTSDIQKHQKGDTSNSAKPVHSVTASAFSSSDPILLPSQNVPLHSAVGTIRRAVGNQHAPTELTADSPTDSMSSSANIASPEVESSHLQQRMPNDVQGAGKNQQLEVLVTASSTIGVSTISRPSSKQGNRSQAVGPQKAGPVKEWKPKSTSSIVGQGPNSSSEVLSVPGVGHPESQPTTDVLTLEEDTSELLKKLENSHISDSQQVIIPGHLHVPGIKKLGLYFGSFGTTYGTELSQNDGTDSGKSPPFSEPEASDRHVNELQLSNQEVFVAAEDVDVSFPDQPQSPPQEPETFQCNEVEVSASINPDYSDSKQVFASETHQHDVIHASPNYNLGFMQPVPNGHFAVMETPESQLRDAPRLPGFYVNQFIDPATYYAQMYRSSIENDGRISPFHPAAGNKYNGDSTMVSPANSQSQELHGGIPHIASPPPLVTQAGAVMQSQFPGQQPLPVFRQQTGLHLPQYSPNYIPYGHYIPPFYVPPHPFPQFVSNGAFPQQPQANNMYPTTPGTAGKYPVSQYKDGSNMGNPTHVGPPAGNYSPYGLSMPNYTPGPAVVAQTSASNEEMVAPQVKQNNIYLNGQQSEGTGVWFPARDISAMQAANSFYNVPQPQIAFTPTQPVPGGFPGMFHHPIMQQSQPITSPPEMVGPTQNVYQQQPQVNWPSSY